MKKQNLWTLAVLLFLASCQLLQPARDTSYRTLPSEEETELPPDDTDPPAPVLTVNFESTQKFEAVLAKSVREHKPVFIDFYATWCGPCKLMDERVYTSKPTIEYLNESFVNYKVDTDSDLGKQLSGQYSVTALPTLLFVDGNGNILIRKEGAAFHSELVELGDKALNLFNRQQEN